MFLKTEDNIGKVKINKTVEIKFPYEGIVINKMTTPCDCNLVYNIKAQPNNYILVKFTPKPVPDHLKSDPKFILGYPFTKKISIYFFLEEKDSKQEESLDLTFKGEAVI